MRLEFAAWAESYSKQHDDFVFLTGDLGFMALETVRAAMKSRFINVGVSEQNMISMAAGLAKEGLSPLCYSIAPFAVFRPAEQTRIDVCLHHLNVKIVGNGGGYGYGIMGATHHAIEDIAFMSSLAKMKCFIPAFNEDVADVCNSMMSYQGPSYLRLNVGKKPEDLPPRPYGSVRQWYEGSDITVVTCGPILLNVHEALKQAKGSYTADVFSISELPLFALPEPILASIRKTGKLVVLEEHVARGGLAENLSLEVLKNGLSCKLTHVCAQGYPDGLYGSQVYHQQRSGLDPASISRTFLEVSTK